MLTAVLKSILRSKPINNLTVLVATDHSLVQVDDAEPHGEGAEAGVARHEAQPRVLQPGLRVGRVEAGLAEAVELCHVAGRVQAPALRLRQADVGVAHLYEVGPQPTCE